MAESARQRRIAEGLEKLFGSRYWGFKVHGNEYQPAGIPDRLGVIDGHFIGFEVKEPNNIASKVQLYTIERIRHAGGIAAVVVTLDDCLAELAKYGIVPIEGR